MARKSTADDGLEELYRKALTDPELSESMLRRIYAYATRHDRTPVLADLLAHPKLPDDLDAALAEDGRARVVVAWASRPGRDPQQLAELAEAETRLTVLKALASVEGLPASAYLAAARSSNGPGAATLVVNPDAPDEAVMVAVPTLAKYLQDKAGRARRSYTFGRKLGPLEVALQRTPEATAVALDEVSSPVLVDRVLSAGDPSRVPADRLAAAASRLRRHHEQAEEEDHSRIYPTDHAVQAWRRLLASHARDHLLPNAKKAHVILGRMASQYRQSAIREMQKDLLRQPKTSTSSTLADRVRTADDHQIDDLVDQAVRTQDGTAARLLVGDRRTSAEQVFRLTGLGQFVWMWARTALSARGREPDVLAALLARFPSNVSDRLLARSPDPEETLRRCIEFAFRAGYVPSKVLQSSFLTHAAVLEAPAATLSDPDLPAATRRTVLVTVEDALADDDEAWATFEHLYNGYDGTVRQLLELSCAVGAGRLHDVA